MSDHVTCVYVWYMRSLASLGGRCVVRSESNIAVVAGVALMVISALGEFGPIAMLFLLGDVSD